MRTMEKQDCSKKRPISAETSEKEMPSSKKIENNSGARIFGSGSNTNPGFNFTTFGLAPIQKYESKLFITDKSIIDKADILEIEMNNGKKRFVKKSWFTSAMPGLRFQISPSNKIKFPYPEWTTCFTLVCINRCSPDTKYTNQDYSFEEIFNVSTLMEFIEICIFCQRDDLISLVDDYFATALWSDNDISNDLIGLIVNKKLPKIAECVKKMLIHNPKKLYYLDTTTMKPEYSKFICGLSSECFIEYFDIWTNFWPDASEDFMEMSGFNEIRIRKIEQKYLERLHNIADRLCGPGGIKEFIYRNNSLILIKKLHLDEDKTQ